MELVKLFMLKHTDAEPVIINNITFMGDMGEAIVAQFGAPLVASLEALVRTLLLLQEIAWSPDASLDEKIHWRGDAVQQFTTPV